MTDTRFITVGGPSDKTISEWKTIGGRPDYNPQPIHKDYALMKVLSMLRIKNATERYVVHPFKWEPTPTPIDFSSLQDSDVIYIVGHGDPRRLYATGPRVEENTRRLVEDLLTADGNLKKKRQDKDIVIVLLSCRSGEDLYKTTAQKLFKALGRDLIVIGATGYTFGSPDTQLYGRNEVLIKGLPWFIEYPMYITKKNAEKETEKREGKKIKYDDKKKEIDAFVEEKEKIEKALKKITDKLKSTEVNKALDEIENNFNDDWRGLAMWQWKLYHRAKTESNLEFDMWFKDLAQGYVWTTGKKVTDAEVAALFAAPVDTINDIGTSIK